jgi:hypothetical protein
MPIFEPAVKGTVSTLQRTLGADKESENSRLQRMLSKEIVLRRIWPMESDEMYKYVDTYTGDHCDLCRLTIVMIIHSATSHKGDNLHFFI